MKNTFSAIGIFFFIFLTPKNMTAQTNSEILSQLFYGAVDIIDQGEDFIDLSVDAVWYASEVNNSITLSGTLTQSTSNPDSWAYSSNPSDKLVLIFANKAVVNFKFAKIDGYADGTADDLKVRTKWILHRKFPE